MKEDLKLFLHPNKTSVQLIERGFDALGYVIRPYARYLRRRTINKALKKIKGMCRSGLSAESVREVAHSYFGILDHADTYKEQSRLKNLLADYGYRACIPGGMA